MQMSEVIASARTAPQPGSNTKSTLYLRQKQTLETMLQHGAISETQYDKSLTDLRRKMFPLEASLPQNSVNMPQ